MTPPCSIEDRAGYQRDAARRQEGAVVTLDEAQVLAFGAIGDREVHPPAVAANLLLGQLAEREDTCASWRWVRTCRT